MEYPELLSECLAKIKKLEEEVEALKKIVGIDAQTDDKPVHGSKRYRLLSEYLYNSNLDRLRLSFSEIERILGFSLPESAYTHKASWANTKTHSIAQSWLVVNYKTSLVDLDNKIIEFEKIPAYMPQP